MTYEEYRNKKSSDKHSLKIIKTILNKLFTIVIFSMIVIILCNYSSKFKSFLIDEVLNKTMDFSKVNNIVDKFKGDLKKEEVIPTMKNESICEKYKDGIKCLNSGNVVLKDGGIVTYIGEKEGYNNTVIVQQSDGYYAWYGNIKESVKLYDYIESGEVIGTSDKEYYYVLLKDDKPIELINES